jgi:hypothetical protein
MEEIMSVKQRWQVSYGKSVYYKVQFEPENHHTKTFDTKAEAVKFLKELHRNPEIDFSDIKRGYYPKSN